MQLYTVQNTVFRHRASVPLQAQQGRVSLTAAVCHVRL